MRWWGPWHDHYVDSAVVVLKPLRVELGFEAGHPLESTAADGLEVEHVPRLCGCRSAVARIELSDREGYAGACAAVTPDTSIVIEASQVGASTTQRLCGCSAICEI